MRGLPPRKPGDTSIGDALNWEWVLDCARREQANVVVVSHDSDYGVPVGDKCCIIDWLSDEFRERVSKRRKVVLTNRLSKALEMMNVTVSAAAKQAEAESLSQTEMVPIMDAIEKLAMIQQRFREVQGRYATIPELAQRLDSPVECIEALAEFTLPRGAWKQGRGKRGHPPTPPGHLTRLPHGPN